MEIPSFENVRLIATDVDGTLLNSHYELDPRFYELVRSLRKSGIVLAVASGRQFHNLRHLFDPVRDELIFIAENGNYIYYQEEELLVETLPEQSVLQLLERTSGIPGTFPILCGKDGAYIEHDNTDFLSELHKYYAVVHRVESLKAAAGRAVMKVTLCDLKDAETNSFPVFQDLLGSFKVKVSGKIWLDISAIHGDKGRAIRFVQDKWDILPEETMVFGDYMNDLEMLQQAGFSFAVANAHPEILRAARYIAPSNDDNGVLRTLEQVLALY